MRNYLPLIRLKNWRLKRERKGYRRGGEKEKRRCRRGSKEKGTQVTRSHSLSFEEIREQMAKFDGQMTGRKERIGVILRHVIYKIISKVLSYCTREHCVLLHNILQSVHFVLYDSYLIELTSSFIMNSETMHLNGRIVIFLWSLNYGTSLL